MVGVVFLLFQVDGNVHPSAFTGTDNTASLAEPAGPAKIKEILASFLCFVSGLIFPTNPFPRRQYLAVPDGFSFLAATTRGKQMEPKEMGVWGGVGMTYEA